MSSTNTILAMLQALRRYQKAKRRTRCTELRAQMLQIAFKSVDLTRLKGKMYF